MKKSYLTIVFVLLILPVLDISAGDDYHFVILSDRTGGANQEAFEMVLMDIERLKPDFIVTVGDLIEGYSDRKSAEKEWDEIFKSMEVITCPVFYTPGNHDIYDKESEKLYMEKTGFKPYYTFDFGNSHFVILNNSVAENIEEMGKEQIEWLENDLSNNKEMENIFVFMHKPFWANGVAKGEEDKLHNVFKENNVDAVFTGHWHQYASNEYDGIRYILIGSSGGDYGDKENIGLGLFYQLLWCKVDGDKLYPTIVKAGNLYDVDLVTIEEEQMTYNIPNNYIYFDTRKGKNKDELSVTVNIFNRTAKEIVNIIKWISKDNWVVKPFKKEVIIKPDDTLKADFILENKDDFYPLPLVEFTYPFGRDKEYDYSRPVHIKREVTCSRTGIKPVIDGTIKGEEWVDAGIIEEFADFNGNKTKVDDTSVRLMHDDSNIYISAVCKEMEIGKLKAIKKERDSSVYTEDCIGFLLSSDGVDIYHFYINPLGTIWDRRVNLEENKAHDDWNAECKAACKIYDDRWVMEIKIPFSEIGITEVDRKIMMNIRRKQFHRDESALWMLDWVYSPSRYGTLRIE